MNLSRLDSGFIYGRVVPVLGVLLGISWALGAPQPVRSVILGALIVCASLGWVFGGGCKGSRDERRAARWEARAERRGHAPDSVSPAPEAEQTPQDRLPGEPSGQSRMNA